MNILEIKASKRDAFGKKESKHFRKEGLIPCVIYGNNESISVCVDEKDVKPLIFTPNSYIVQFDVDGEKIKAVIREVQYHPVRDNILHIDFYHIVGDKPISIDIPVLLTGVSEGVKQGGKLALSKRKLRVLGKEEDLPNELTIDVSSLELGKSIFVGDLDFDGLQILTPASTAVCAVRMTRAARGAAAAAGK